MSHKPMDDFSEENSYDQSFFISAPPTDMIYSVIDWNAVLGYGVRPNDVVRDIMAENGHSGPYSWDLACRIAKIAQIGESLNNNPIVSKRLFNEWFNDLFGPVIKNEKMQGIRRPASSKGFWGSLFGCISVALTIMCFVGCGANEPSNQEIAQGMMQSFVDETGAHPSELAAKATKIGKGRWDVKLRVNHNGKQRILNATAVMDKNGDIHYYTE